MYEEERYRKWKQLDDSMKFLQEQGESFHNTLEQSLKKIVLEHRALVKDKEQQVQQQLKKIIEKGVRSVFEAFDFVLSASYHNKELKTVTSGFKTQTKAEAEEQLKKELESFPKEGWEKYSASFWEMYEHEKKIEKFISDVFEEAKKVLVCHYEDEILNLDADSLRYLNKEISFWAHHEFVESVFVLEKDIRHNYQP